MLWLGRYEEIDNQFVWLLVFTEKAVHHKHGEIGSAKE